MTESRLVSAAGSDEERQFEAALRPKKLTDFTGQKRLKENLQIAIDAARKRGEAMDHVLLYGPPGLGKTTLASIIAQELDVPFQQTSGPVLQKKLDLSGILSGIQPRQVFFIDEIHRLLPDVEEMLYSALEDFHLDILIGTGPGARTHSIPLQKFTAIGATTRQGLVSAPLRGRFGLVLRLNHYDVAELKTIVERSARLLDTPVDDEGASEIARRARGTPRIANRLLRRVRDYAQVRAHGRITLDVAVTALNLLEVDRFGLDEIDQKIMRTVLEKFRGGPVGINTIAAAVGEEAETIEEVYEPYLIQLGFLHRSPRGRVATESAWDYFQVPAAVRRHGSAAGVVLKIVYLGLGSNMGDSEALLKTALAELEAPGLRLLRVSSLYETEPIGLREQRWFLNLVAEFETDLFPKQLLHRMQKIEMGMGRRRTVENGPRTIDIDILLFGNAVMKTEELEIPHPRYRERRFTLAPLAELNPGLRDPVRAKRWPNCWPP